MSPPTRRTALQLLGTAGIASLAGCPSRSTTPDDGEQPPDALGTSWTAPDDEWRFPRAGVRNTAHSTATARQQPTGEWTTHPQSTGQAGLQQTHFAAATRELVIGGTERTDGLELTAYDAADGTNRWSHRLGDPDSMYPQFGGLVDGTLYLSDFETDVIAVDTSDGTVRWRVDLYERVAETVPKQYLLESTQSPEEFRPVPAATPDCIYVQTSYGVHGLAPGDGHERWRISLGDELEDDSVLQDPGGLAVTTDRVLASYARPDRLLYGIRRDDELAVDRTTVPVRYPSRPLVTGTGTTALGSGVLWSTDAEGTLATGTAGTRAVTWAFQGMASTGAAAFSGLASDGRRVFVCEGHEQTAKFVVFALRADTGGLEWVFQESMPEHGIELSPDPDFRVAQPAVAGETLLVGYGTGTGQERAMGNLVALSTTEGTTRWRTSLPLTPRDIAPTDAGLYLRGRHGGIRCLTQS